MSTTSAPTLTFRAHEVVVPSHQRTHRRAVIRWALANGRAVHRDALAALIGARSDAVPANQTEQTDPAGHPPIWTGPDIGALLWVGVADWCADRGAEVPDADHVATTLSTYLRFLSAHRLLARGSDPVAALRRAVTEYGGTTRSAAHPSMRQRSVAPVLPLA
jgi:hypothetical protein